METQRVNSDNGNQLFLTGAILCANLDYSGLLDYALKAFIGGIIWMSFKLAADYITFKRKRK
jgi:hypothetical protein